MIGFDKSSAGFGKTHRAGLGPIGLACDVTRLTADDVRPRAIPLRGTAAQGATGDLTLNTTNHNQETPLSHFFRSTASRWTSAVALAALATAGLLSGCGGNDDDAGAQPVRAPDTAVLADGSVQAVDRLGMRSYFAIPYATPPVGALRWQAPKAPARWTTPLARNASANPCVQTSASPFRLANGQEDCLYVDVHTPSTATGPFPVMVWLHGGAFNTGGTGPYQDPSPLVSQGVIVVNVAYRMGALGFLGHPALRAADGSVGNYGILDQQAALRWVRDNIGAFGGNPGNVTIFGESAGGFSVLTHLASPLSRGLFHKAIVQSGGYGFDRQQTQAQLEASSTTIVNNTLTAAGVACAQVDADCLRGLSATVAANQLGTAFNTALSSPVPSVDGLVLPKSIKATFAAGENSKVPVINGSNENEYSLFLAISENGRRAAAVPPNLDPANTSFVTSQAAYPATLLALSAGTGVSSATLTTTAYPLASFGGTADPLAPTRGATSLGTDVIFACPGLQFSRRVNTQATPVWMYEFRDQTALPSIGTDANGNATLSTPQGAGHSYEIQYLFNLRDLRTAERRDLQTAMARYWTNFARSNDPNTGTAPATAWPRFAGNGTSDVLGLDVASAGGVGALTTSFEAAHQCAATWSMLTF
jgi:para-nitrobenzyl esterase